MERQYRWRPLRLLPMIYANKYLRKSPRILLWQESNTRENARALSMRLQLTSKKTKQSSIRKLKVDKEMNFNCGIWRVLLRETVNWSCLVSMTRWENRCFGIQVPIFWDKVYRLYMGHGSVMVLLWKKASFMILFLDSIEFLRQTMKQFKRSFGAMLRRNSSSSEFCWVSQKHCSFFHIIHSSSI